MVDRCCLMVIRRGRISRPDVATATFVQSSELQLQWGRSDNCSPKTLALPVKVLLGIAAYDALKRPTESYLVLKVSSEKPAGSSLLIPQGLLIALDGETCS